MTLRVTSLRSVVVARPVQTVELFSAATRCQEVEYPVNPGNVVTVFSAEHVVQEPVLHSYLFS
jgi:hypothetical protein